MAVRRQVVRDLRRWVAREMGKSAGLQRPAVSAPKTPSANNGPVMHPRAPGGGMIGFPGLASFLMQLAQATGKPLAHNNVSAVGRVGR